MKIIEHTCSYYRLSFPGRTEELHLLYDDSFHLFFGRSHHLDEVLLRLVQTIHVCLTKFGVHVELPHAPLYTALFAEAETVSELTLKTVAVLSSNTN